MWKSIDSNKTCVSIVWPLCFLLPDASMAMGTAKAANKGHHRDVFKLDSRKSIPFEIFDHLQSTCELLSRSGIPPVSKLEQSKC